LAHDFEPRTTTDNTATKDLLNDDMDETVDELQGDNVPASLFTLPYEIITGSLLPLLGVNGIPHPSEQAHKDRHPPPWRNVSISTLSANRPTLLAPTDL
jgi:hypothetical protein